MAGRKATATRHVSLSSILLFVVAENRNLRLTVLGVIYKDSALTEVESAFSGLLTWVEIGHIRIRLVGNFDVFDGHREVGRGLIYVKPQQAVRL